MPAKFLVVECEDNDNAVKLVRLMLENGFSRMMLLDDLSKHPSLISQSCSDKASTAVTSDFASSPSLPTTCLEDCKSNIRLSTTPQTSRSDPESRILELIHSYNDDENIFQTNSDHIMDDDGSGECLADNEETPNNFFDFSEGFDLLAQAQQSLVAASGDMPPQKKAKAILDSCDPEKYYHKCRLCGTKVKAPRGGRWNLQMHVLAMHSNQRSLKCPKCNYTDYRKPGMRKHTILTHGADLPPIDIATNEKRKEWDEVMAQCFPEFAHRTGFLEKS